MALTKQQLWDALPPFDLGNALKGATYVECFTARNHNPTYFMVSGPSNVLVRHYPGDDFIATWVNSGEWLTWGERGENTIDEMYAYFRMWDDTVYLEWLKGKD